MTNHQGVVRSVWSWLLPTGNKDGVKGPTCIERKVSQCPAADVHVPVVALPPLVTLSRNEISPSLCQLLNEVSEAHSSAQLDQHKGFLIREKVHVIGVVSLEPTTPHCYQRGCLMWCFTLFSKHSTEDSGTVPKLNELSEKVSLFISRKITFMKKILASQIKLTIIFSPPHSVKRDRKYSRIYFFKLQVDQPSRKL